MKKYTVKIDFEISDNARIDTLEYLLEKKVNAWVEENELLGLRASRVGSFLKVNNPKSVAEFRRLHGNGINDFDGDSYGK
tara:strand:+ start:4315 stop:4554 length:240 start_codon:yes stop_codon:yes gene_type:complete